MVIIIIINISRWKASGQISILVLNCAGVYRKIALKLAHINTGSVIAERIRQYMRLNRLR